MKKVLIALTVCAFLASCGGGSSSSEAAKDSTSTMSADTSKMAAPATVDNLVLFKNSIPKDATWSAFGIGKAHLPILYATIALGGNVRVGLEDNVYYSKDRLASNVELVERAVRLIKEADKEVASPNEARRILGLKGLDK